MSLASEIASRMMLTTLNTGAWRPNKLHKAETLAERQRHNSKAPKVIVELCDAPELKRIMSIQQGLYMARKRLTTPTVQDGVRMISAQRIVEDETLCNEATANHEKALDTFDAVYQDCKDAAPMALNGLYDPTHWPDSVREKFHLTVRYLPCPDQGVWADWLEESAHAAQAELAERATKTLQHVIDRCKSDGPLYESVFARCQDLATLLPELDIARTIPQNVIDGLSKLGGVNVDACRDNESLRGNVAQEARDILAAFGR